MTRSIQVSLDVFQAIWTRRQAGEANEDAILRRVLQVPTTVREAENTDDTTTPSRNLKVQIGGFHDPRYGVKVPSGFEIFRNYKGKEYRASAVQGFWLLGNTGYATLNELNTAIGITHENAWKAWRFKDEKGRIRPLSDLRDQSKIVRRRPTLEDVL